MNRRFKRTLVTLLEPRPIIFGFALFNFILIWIQARNLAISGIACVVCPWYHPWSYGNEPTLLLVAAVLLILKRFSSNAGALTLCSYLLACVLYLFRITNGALVQEWRYLRRFTPYVVGSWHSQYVFALIILCFATFYLARDILPTNGLRRCRMAFALRR